MSEPARTLVGYPTSARSDDAAATLVEAPKLFDVVHGEIIIPGSTDPFPTMIGPSGFSAQRGGHAQLVTRPTTLQIAVARSNALTRRAPDDETTALEVHGKWRDFEDIGLTPNPVTKAAQKLVVSSYRLLGFGILTLIIVVLVAYISTTAFYFLNHTWLTPVAISANDEKVVALQGQLAQQLNVRAQLVSDLDQADRTIKSEQLFQMQFVKAVKQDLEGRRVALENMRQLQTTAGAARDEIRATNGDYSSSTASRMKNEYDAGLIDRNAMLAGKFQLAQITSANLSLAERQAEYDQRATELASATQSLDAILSDKSHAQALSYDVLKIQRDYEASKLALARETSNRERLKGSIGRQDKIIAGLNQSAYLKALADHATVALVPYSNLDHVSKDTPLYGCRLNMVMCHQVGKVLEVLPGEVLVKHPNRESMIRGIMVEMQLTEPEAAQDEVLFADHAPLGF